MNHRLIILLSILFWGPQVFAQDFYGAVKKADSTATPVYQATVEITEAGKPFKTLKTYFDGAFKFTPAKSQAYSVKISYNGYKDTTYNFTTDAKGLPSAQNVTVKLKKDGMRLMGVIRSREENFPIKEATIVLKNVMTRKEDRITTDIDGRYNFKLEYETNYKVAIDKRSIGIFNKYRDTSFYVSTIGFNQPLDYKLDISLDPMLYPTTIAREGYDATKAINANLKPVIDVTANKNSQNQPFVAENEKLKNAEEANAKLLAELEKAKKVIEDLKNKEADQKKPSGGGIVINKKAKTKDDPNLEVVVIPDKPVTGSPNPTDASTGQKAKNDSIALAKTQKMRDDSLALAKAEQDKAAKELAAKQAREDSVNKAVAAAKAKLISDSIAKLNTVVKEKARQDSVAVAKAEKEQHAKELAIKKALQDSLNRAIAATRVKIVQDSIATAKAALSAKEKNRQDSISGVKAEQARITKELVAKKAIEDSIKKALAADRAKFVLDSVTRVKAEIAAVKTKAKQDSIATAKIEQERIAKELALKKAQQDSVSKVRAEQAKAAKESALKTAREDSINRALAAARAKFVTDSINKAKAAMAILKAKAAKAEQEAIAYERALRKAYDDSVKKVAAAIRATFVQDSIAKRTARIKFVQDSVSRVKTELAAKAKARQDSVRVEKENAMLAAKKAREDSLWNLEIAARAKFVRDSIAKARSATEETSSGVATNTPAAPKKTDYGIFPAVLFEKNMFVLSDGAKAELNPVVQKLISQPQLQINIYAFASADESGALSLSLNRFNGVLRFLLDNGVPIKQVKSFYYGSTVSRNECTDANCPEEQLKQNRSVAYQLITSK